ncbi:MAG TPA: sigma-70 family RNA polymerase sigma factor [Pyrinomonadaceae bacterium]|nr:sigma-70 family RNA polymerase sigma factor [Pyrinomonadaceae bacterium]
MSREQRATEPQTPDPAAWVDEHGDYLYRYALFRLRDPSRAEDAVQETLLAALQAYGNFAGRGSERTWLVGVLKHKVADQFRRLCREAQVARRDDEEFAHEEFFRAAGEWKDHWEVDCAPGDWGASPEALVEQGEFWSVFQDCLRPLPERTAGAFVMREVDGLTSEEICEVLGVKVNNLWVMLHRARLHLRRCLELNWFRRPGGRH